MKSNKEDIREKLIWYHRRRQFNLQGRFLENDE